MNDRAFQITPPSPEVERESTRRFILTLHPATTGEAFASMCAMYPAPGCNQN